MPQRFIRPVAPYLAPTGLTAGDLPFAAVPFDADAPTTEIMDKSVQFQHVQTKSTVNNATAYREPDACGNLYFTKGGVSSNINALVDCNLVGIFSGSLSVTVPSDITEPDFAEFVETLKAALYLKISQLPV